MQICNSLELFESKAFNHTFIRHHRQNKQFLKIQLNRECKRVKKISFTHERHQVFEVCLHYLVVTNRRFISSIYQDTKPILNRRVYSHTHNIKLELLMLSTISCLIRYGCNFMCNSCCTLYIKVKLQKQESLSRQYCFLDLTYDTTQNYYLPFNVSGTYEKLFLIDVVMYNL